MTVITVTEDILFLRVKVTPQSRQNQVLPYQAEEDAIRIKVTAPPEDGKANKAVCKYLAQHLDMPVSQIKITAGESSRNKKIAIHLNPAVAHTKQIDAIKTRLSIQ